MKCRECDSFHRQDTCPMGIPKIEVENGVIKVHEDLLLVDEGDCAEHEGSIVFSETDCECGK